MPPYRLGSDVSSNPKNRDTKKESRCKATRSGQSSTSKDTATSLKPDMQTNMGSPESWNRPKGDTRGSSPTLRTHPGRKPSLYRKKQPCIPMAKLGHTQVLQHRLHLLRQTNSAARVDKHQIQKSSEKVQKKCCVKSNEKHQSKVGPARTPEKPYPQQTTNQTNHNAKTQTHQSSTRKSKTKLK